jgi:hypothetical protein
MNQQALFFETIFDAIGADIAACGGFKAVAGKLWPTESVTTASAKLRNCVNPDQPHKLCPQEVLRIKQLAKEVGSFATISFESTELGFKFNFVEAQQEARAIHERCLAALEIIQRDLKIGNRMMEETRTTLRAVK